MQSKIMGLLIVGSTMSSCSGFKAAESLEEGKNSLESVSLESTPGQFMLIPKKGESMMGTDIILKSPSIPATQVVTPSIPATQVVTPSMPATQVAAPSINRNMAETIVQKVYRDVLQREVDATGISYYSDLIIKNLMDEDSLKKALYDSDEFFVISIYIKQLNRRPDLDDRKAGLKFISDNGREAFKNIIAYSSVQILYRRILQREVDNTGLIYYSDLIIKNQMDENSLEKALYNSDEYFAISIFNKYFNRIPSIDERTLSLKYISAHGREEFEKAIAYAAAPKPINQPTNESLVQGFYREFLFREAENSGLKYWVNELSTGKSPDQVKYEIANSPEAIVQAVYRSLLGRLAEKSGLDYWMAQLASGHLNRAGLENAIKASDEYILRSTGNK